MDYTVINSFVERLAKIGIEVKLISNIPYIYLDRVNDKKIQEIYMSDHGFNAFWFPVRVGGKIKPTNITELFKIIRKYR